MINNEYILLIHIISSFFFLNISFLLGKYALVSFIVIQAILANMFILKQITLGGLTATTTDAYMVVSMIGLQLLQEYYGKNIARKTILYTFLFLLFATISSQFTLFYHPAPYDQAHMHLKYILDIMPRITISSIGVYIFSLSFDSILYATLHRFFRTRYLVFRNMFCTSISQFVDTFLFSFLGLWGILHNIWHIIFISYAIKMIAIFISIPFLIIIRTYGAQKKSS